MPTWKKLTTNGSDASFNSVTVTTFVSASSFTGSLQGTASYATSASYALTASYTPGSGTAVSASYALSASYAATASYADNFTVKGTLTAQTLVVQTVSTSVEYSSGSNVFGNSLSNTQQFTGSVTITGSLAVNNSPVVLSSQTASMSVLSASYALTASYWSGSILSASYAANSTSASFATVATSASYAATASYWSGSILSASHANLADTALSSNTAVTASFSLQSLSASIAQLAISSSYALTASYAMNGGGGGGTGISAIYIANQGTLQGTASYFNFNGAGVTATITAGTASIYIPGGSGSSGGNGINAANAVLSQSAAATTWSFIHNLGTQYPVFTIFDNNNNVIIPQQINATSTSSATIYFSTPRTGIAVASLGGNVVTSSYALAGSGSFSGSFYGTASNAVSASYALSSSYAALLNGTASGVFATTASNTFIGTETITGSLLISGSTTQVGNNNLLGNTLISGSLIISGALGQPSPTITVIGDLNQRGYTRYLPVQASIDNAISASYIYVSGSTNDLYFTQNGNGYQNTTRLRWLESNLYTGLLSGGVISGSLGSTSFTITSGSAIIVTLGASTGSADPYPTVKKVAWNNISAPLTYSGSAKITYVGIDGNGAIVQQTVPWGSTDVSQWDTQVELGVVLHLSGSVVTGLYNSPQVSYGFPQRADDFIRAFGPIKISGHTLQASGSSLSIIKTGGTAYNDGANYINNPNHPSTVVDPAINTSKIYRYYMSGSTPIIDTGVANAGYTTIDPTQYNNNGTLASVPTNGANLRWTIQRVFWIPNSPTNAFLVYYGNTLYASVVDAQNGIGTEAFTEAPNTAQNGILIGYIIVAGNETNLQNATIVQGGLFRSVNGIGSSNTSPISTTLAGLSDVQVSSRTTGDLLYYNGSQWVNNKQLTGTYGITGSLGVTGGVTANLTGTASYASQALSSSYSVSSSYSATATSSSYALTASYALNAGAGAGFPYSGSAVVTGSLYVSGSGITGSSYMIGSASLTYGSLSGSISGNNIVFSQVTGSYTSANYHYTVNSGSNYRAGNVIAVWFNNTVQYTDFSTADIGTTTNVTMSVSMSAGQAQLNAITNNAGWVVKSTVTYI